MPDGALKAWSERRVERRFRATKTARQIVLFFVLCFTGATIVLGAGVYWVGSRAIHGQLDVVIATDMTGLIRSYQAGGRPALERALQRRDDRGVNTLGYLLVDAAGNRLGGELDVAPPPLGWHDIAFRDQDGKLHPARALTRRLPDGAFITAATEASVARALEKTIVLIFGLGLAIMLAIGLGGGILLGRAIRDRLETMNTTALAIIGGDLASRVPLSGRDDEFDRLATTLNQMLDRIDTLVKNVRGVSSGLAHELRSPITRLRQRLERVVLNGAPEATLAELELALDDTDRILSLFSSLLRISEVEAASIRRYFRAVDLSAVVRDIADSYVPVADDRGFPFFRTIEPALRVRGDRELLSQLIVNLIENVLAHTPPGTRIELTLERRARRQVLLRVADKGPGLSPAERARLGERFYRGDGARGENGHGLGLNLVAAIVEAHGGTLRFVDNAPGLAAEVRLLLQN